MTLPSRFKYLAPLLLVVLVACTDPWNRQQGEPGSSAPPVHTESSNGDDHSDDH